MGCRIKSGIVDSSMAGATCRQQVYLKGLLDILRRIDTIDFRELYCGHLSLGDYIRKSKEKESLGTEDLQLPHFLDSDEKYKEYIQHCNDLIEENQLTTFTQLGANEIANSKSRISATNRMLSVHD